VKGASEDQEQRPCQSNVQQQVHLGHSGPKGQGLANNDVVNGIVVDVYPAPPM
jgi:hypothetical protein